MDTLHRLRTLIALAAADGELGEKERHFILSIGLANHLMVAEVLPLFALPATSAKDVVLTRNKEELLLELVQLMQIDGKIYQAEMRFCAHVAARLGFREEAIFELMLRAHEFAADKQKLVQALGDYGAV
ncbi:MAG: hypothetical protein JNN04_08655 [Cyclobacteriaceae bacterium]|nr:hypothetical protein [Cyclobacteriaceae bacterium]